MAGLPTLGVNLSGKRALIDKANASMLAIIGVTSFVVTFSLVSCKALFSQSTYQGRVIKSKDTALRTLKQNNKNITSLVSSYSTFANGATNVLGGNPSGSGPLDGDNPRIVLDALPSKYDFPGLVSGLNRVLTQGGYKGIVIGGTDDEVAQQEAGTDVAAPVEIPFPLTIITDYNGARNLLLTLEKSIRPMYVDKVGITASSSNVTINVSAKTYYMPEKTLKISTKVVK